jgi:gluconate 2-dehydrogenase gamma chain
VNWYRNVSRREFIRIAAAAAAASGTVSCTSARSPWRFLRVDEARTLAAICDQLIPPDADPGAEWACVVNFIDLQLCGPYRALRSTYRDGIAHMDEMGRVQFGKVFAESSGDEQIRLLIALEKGKAPKDIWKTVSPQGFFEIVLAHTMQGFYGDPRHGGNRDRASWKMVGLTYPPVRGRLHYDVTKA